MWVTYGIQELLSLDLGFLGIRPRHFKGALGILTGPLVHGNYSHLVSNSLPLLFLGTTLYFFYRRIAGRVLFQCYFFTNLLVWIFARDWFYHIGASGIVYALAFFLISFGGFRRDLLSLVISIVILLCYGGLLYGMSPANAHISWESHLLGAIVGIGAAFSMSKVKKVN